MADVFGNASSAPFFATRADHRQQCRPSATDVGISAARHRSAGRHANRGRRDDVRHIGPGDGRRAEHAKWAPPLAVEPAHCTKCAQPGFSTVNRGVAIVDGTVYVGTLDGYLVALDATSGIERWTVPVAENPTGHAITAAPLAVDGKIIVGISGGEAGIRGFLDAYDAKTGKRLWRFWTIPAPGEPGSDTWAGDSWKQGGGATWLTGSYDPALKLLYWGTGNPGPDWNGDLRKGDNLYTCSLVALDVDTGRLRWHFQFTPHDVHDWDANQIPVLVDADIDGGARALVVTGESQWVLLRARSQEWRVYPRRGIREANLGRRAGQTGPADPAAREWNHRKRARSCIRVCKARPTGRVPPYSPATNMLYVPVREMGSIYFKSDVEYRPGTYYTGGSEKALSEEAWGAVRAIDVRPPSGRGISGCRHRRGPG